MKIEQLEELKKKIDSAKNKKARAEGTLDGIKKRLKEEFGVSTLKEAQEKLSTLEADIEKDESRLKELLEELDGVTDWESL